MVAAAKPALTATSLPKATTALSPKFVRSESWPPFMVMVPVPRTFAWPDCWKPTSVPLLRTIPPEAVVLGWA